MIDAACISAVTVSNIKVEEKGKSAIIRNEDRAVYKKVKVDGCVQANGPLADWAVERGDAAVIIELKGRNVEHGADQIIATAERWTISEHRCGRVAGLIVGRQTPGASTAMQIKQREFAKRFRGPLHVVHSNCAYAFDALLSFKGPHKI